MSADVSEAVREEVRKTLSWFAGEIGAAERGNPRTRKARKLHLIGEATNMVVGLAALQEGSGALPASPSGGQEKAWLEDAWLKAEAHLSEVSAAIGTCRFMDPPDGGDPTLALQVRRMRAALDTAEAALAKYEDPSEVGMEPLKEAECAQPNQPRDREGEEYETRLAYNPHSASGFGLVVEKKSATLSPKNTESEQ